MIFSVTNDDIADTYMLYLKLEFKFQITIPKFEGENGLMYTVVVI